MVSAIVGATWLFLLTDVDALYDKNPNVHPDAKPIRVVDDIDSVVKEGMPGAGWVMARSRSSGWY
jgi:glutamate 5-kinase